MKVLAGTVISTKMNKTVVVQVVRQWTHPLYQKTVKRTKKYLVHDEQAAAKVGDYVSFNSSRPISKHKHFRLNQIITTAPQGEAGK